MELKDKLLNFIRTNCKDKYDIEIAKAIKIPKQTFSKYISGQIKSIKGENSVKITRWAQSIDPNIDDNWLKDDAIQTYNVKITLLDGLDLSQKTIEAIKTLTKEELSPLLNYLFEHKEFYDILIEIKKQQDNIKKQAMNREPLDLEFAEFKLQKSIFNLVNTISKEYSKIYSTYYVKKLVPNDKQKEAKDEQN